MREGWQAKRLDEVCDFKGGGTPSKAVDRFWRGDIPWVSPKDMKSQVVLDSIDHITPEAISASATSMIDPGSILIVVRSGILARTVPIAVAGRAIAINQDLKALCPRPAMDSWFLYYLLEAKMSVLLSLVSRGATVHRLITDQIRAVEFMLPPLAEQRRIVAILDEAFEGIATAKANAEKNLRNARELFEWHHQAAFSRAREVSNDQRLGDIASFRNGINYTKQSKGCLVRIIGVRNFQDHFWAPTDDLDSVTLDGDLGAADAVEEGDILSVRSNGNPELIGRCMLVGKFSGRSLMATSNSPTCGHSNSPRQDGVDYGFRGRV